MACLVLPQAKAFNEFHRGAFAGDDKFSVDRLLQSCQPKVMPALPSAGRELIPYFSSPEECVDETLSQTKTDSARQRRKAGKRSPAVSASLAPSASLATSPPKENSPRKSVAKCMPQKRLDDSESSSVKSKYAQAPGTKSYDVAAGNARLSLPLTSKDLKTWAGPSYYTSPPPEHLPMPTSFLLAV